jgi:hypothetical protein
MRRQLALLFALLLLGSTAGTGPWLPDDSGWGADKCVLWVCPSD